MKVGMLTSWQTKCGISEYSGYLVDALRKQPDTEVIVFGSKNYGDFKIGEYVTNEVPTFGVLPWTGAHKDHSFDSDKILAAQLDVLHVQYECVLYNQPPFYQLLKDFEGVKAVTYHDNCIPPDFPYHLFDIQYTHRENVGVGSGFIIPMGIQEHKPVVKTFGLGRSKKDLIREICERNGWEFQYSFGEDSWLSPDALYKYLRDSDCIVLYYDEAAAAGTSIAARVAISTRRPLVVSATTWFKDLDVSRQVNKVYNSAELEEVLHDILDNPLITDSSWSNIAKYLVDDYKEALDAHRDF